MVLHVTTSDLWPLPCNLYLTVITHTFLMVFHCLGYKRSSNSALKVIFHTNPIQVYWSSINRSIHLMNIVDLAINLPSEEAILSISCELLCINWNVPQAAAYTLYRQPLNKAWVWATGCKQSLPGYPQGQSRTCYQECGCHLFYNRIWTHSIMERFYICPMIQENECPPEEISEWTSVSLCPDIFMTTNPYLLSLYPTFSPTA